jgi:uncharacterized protein
MPTMSLSTQAVFRQMLGALDKILDKLATHCEARKIDQTVFLTMRLSPDMFTFTRQVQVACDFAKGCAARLGGQDVPSWADDEVTIAELKARIARTLAFVDAIPASIIDGSEAKIIRIKLGRNAPETEMSGADYAIHVALPNFYFHVTAAYAILRHAGLEIGKGNFLGRA